MAFARFAGMDTITSNSPEATHQLGVKWAEEMEPGWVVGLSGDLGAGKTQLVKGLAQGWKIQGRVASPTFTLMHEYQVENGTLYHLDLYRLETPDAIWDAGMAEYLRVPMPGWVIVEWIDRWTMEELHHRTRIPDVKKPFRWVHIQGDLDMQRMISYEDFRD